MTDRSSLAVIVSGIAVTSLAVWSITTSTAAGPGESTQHPEPTVATASPSTTVVPQVVHIATPPPEIAGVSTAVARLLAAEGFAAEVGEGEVEGELPGSVVRVLAERGIALAVADEAPEPAP